MPVINAQSGVDNIAALPIVASPNEEVNAHIDNTSNIGEITSETANKNGAATQSVRPKKLNSKDKHLRSVACTEHAVATVIKALDDGKTPIEA